jgi:hypothetical protein
MMSTKPTSKGEVTLQDCWGGRYYVVDETKYVSTTTPLSLLSAPMIGLWEIRVGKTKAAIHSGRAANYGTKIHNFAADMLEGKLDLDGIEELHEKYQPELKAIWDWIEENVDELIGVEKTVYSNTWKLAGAVDIISTLKGREGIYWLDWKTGRIKDEAFLQLASYNKITMECAEDEFEGRALELLKSTDDHRRLILDVKRSDATGLGRVREVEHPLVKDLTENRKEAEADSLRSDWQTYINVLSVWRWYMDLRAIRAAKKVVKKAAKDKLDKEKAERKAIREAKKKEKI